MFLSAWVLFCTLAIANLQRVAKPEEPVYVQDQLCTDRLINDYFVRTTVVRGPSPQEYCMNETSDDTEDDTDDESEKKIDLHQVIELYKTYNFTIAYEHVTPNSPITQSGVLAINDHQELPLYLKADIRHHHIRINTDSVLGRDADEQMGLMGQLATDDRACLLPYSIGGARGINVVPMAQNVHRLPVEKSDSSDLDPPSSSWKSCEDWILKFLQTYPDGRVAWSVAVQYGDDVVADPVRHRAYRPVGFARQFSAYMNETVKSLFYKGNETTLNNHEESCGEYFSENILPVPSNCRVPVRTSTCNNSVMGITRGRGFNEAPLIVASPYTIEEKSYFYSQYLMEGLQWFIQEILPSGKLGERISRGRRRYLYKIIFAYSIRGKQFLYSHRGYAGTYWFIQELLPDGQMGSKKSDGIWKYAHRIAIPFTVAGKQYFYGQIESINMWFIRELLRNGQMGQVTSYGNKMSPVVCVYEANYTMFLYSHDPLLMSWNTHELLPGGKMGELMSEGHWTFGHHSAVPFSIGQPRFFAQNFYDTRWFIQELLLEGEMGVRIAEGATDLPHEVAFSYVDNRKQYLFTHSQLNLAWVIREV